VIRSLRHLLGHDHERHLGLVAPDDDADVLADRCLRDGPRQRTVIDVAAVPAQDHVAGA